MRDDRGLPDLFTDNLGLSCGFLFCSRLLYHRGWRRFAGAGRDRWRALDFGLQPDLQGPMVLRDFYPIAVRSEFWAKARDSGEDRKAVVPPKTPRRQSRFSPSCSAVCPPGSFAGRGDVLVIGIYLRRRISRCQTPYLSQRQAQALRRQPHRVVLPYSTTRAFAQILDIQRHFHATLIALGGSFAMAREMM